MPADKSTLRLFALALMAGVSCAYAAPMSLIAGKLQCTIIGNSNQCARSLETALHAPFLHRASHGRLDVDLMDGRSYSFADNDVNGAEAVLYAAVEVAGGTRYVIVHRHLHEGHGYGVLDRKSGTFTTFAAYPAFSPDERWVAVADGDVAADGGLKVFEVAGGTFRLAFEAAQAEVRWWPTRLEWQSSTSLLYERSGFGSENEIEAVDVKLQFDGKSWR